MMFTDGLTNGFSMRCTPRMLFGHWPSGLRVMEAGQDLPLSQDTNCQRGTDAGP